MTYSVYKKMAQNNVANIVDIRTMSDEEYMAAWAKDNKISLEAIEKLSQDGFTSMQALKLVDKDDLAKAKLPRGQQKLILASIQKLLQDEALAQAVIVQLDQSEAAVDVNTARNTSAQTGVTHSDIRLTGDAAATTETSAPTTTHAQPSTSACQNQNGDSQRVEDPYISALLQQFRGGQGQNNLPSVGPNLHCEKLIASSLGGLGISSNLQDNATQQPNSRESLLASSSPLQTQSWRDPQIYLAAAASGKSITTFYDITEFVVGNMEEEIVVGGNGSQQVVLKSGPKKPKLESITLAQWSVANLAILYRLLGDGKLDATNILDYLSYTTKICQLVQKFNLVSVLLYDREYRRLQAAHGFRWGTDVPHLQSVHLQPRLNKQTFPHTGKNNLMGHQKQSHHGPFTADGKVICKLFNSKAGCHFKDCKFVHQCSYAGCQQTHSAVTHAQTKNM